MEVLNYDHCKLKTEIVSCLPQSEAKKSQNYENKFELNQAFIRSEIRTWAALELSLSVDVRPLAVGKLKYWFFALVVSRF